MSKREPIKTTKEAIISYWAKHQDECGLSVDWAEAGERCWRCGCERSLDRCHIIPDSLGGKDEPENLVLLCKRCHADGPNVADPEIMWDWIRAYGVSFYDTFWGCEGMREYKFIYGYKFRSALRYILDHSENELDERKMQEYISKEIKSLADRSRVHFGQNYWNTATYAGNLRMIIKSLAEKQGINIKEIDKELQQNKSSWWLEAF